MTDRLLDNLVFDGEFPVITLDKNWVSELFDSKESPNRVSAMLGRIFVYMSGKKTFMLSLGLTMPDHYEEVNNVPKNLRFFEI